MKNKIEEKNEEQQPKIEEQHKIKEQNRTITQKRRTNTTHIHEYNPNRSIQNSILERFFKKFEIRNMEIREGRWEMKRDIAQYLAYKENEYVLVTKCFVTKIKRDKMATKSLSQKSF